MEEKPDKTILDKEIELKKLEIEKLKLQKELTGDFYQQKSYIPDIAPKKRENRKIILNLIFLAFVFFVLYVIPWGSIGSNFKSDFGNQSYSSGNITGFNFGLFTYSLPLTMVNILMLIFIFKSSRKSIITVSGIGIFISIFANLILLQASEMRTGFSSSIGNTRVTTGLDSNGWAYALPISYLLILIYNIFQKSVGSFSSVEMQNINTIEHNFIQAETPKPIQTTYYLLNDKDSLISLININTLITFAVFMLSTYYVFSGTKQHFFLILNDQRKITLLISGILLIFTLIMFFKKGSIKTKLLEKRMLELRFISMLCLILSISLYVICVYVLLNSTFPFDESFIVDVNQYIGNENTKSVIPFFILTAIFMLTSLVISGNIASFKEINSDQISNETAL